MQKTAYFIRFSTYILYGIPFYTWFYVYYSNMHVYFTILSNYTFLPVLCRFFVSFLMILAGLYMLFESFLSCFLCTVLYTALLYNYTWDFIKSSLNQFLCILHNSVNTLTNRPPCGLGALAH